VDRETATATVVDVRDDRIDRFGVLAEHSPDLILSLTPDRRIQAASPRAATLLGWEPATLIGRGFAELIHPDDRGGADAVPVGAWARVRLAHRRGGWVWCETSTRDGLTTVRDISARHAAEVRLAHAVHYDALTGLPNRRLLVERLTATFDRSRRTRRPVTILFCDLDRFKVVNQSGGHDAGDELLQRVARRIATGLGRDDLLYRVGGDEFVAVCEAIDGAAAESVAEILRRAVEQPFTLSRRHAYVTTSIGLRVVGPDERITPERALRDADTAMHLAKDAGGNRIVAYSPDLHRRLMRRSELAQGLRQAVARDELMLCFQPVVDLLNGRVLGVEALVRWEQPGGEVIQPTEFIPIAEETGLIGDIGDWVLDRAVEQVEAWRWDGFDLPFLSVNVSFCQLASDEFVQRVRRIVDSGRLGSTQLGLELTETSVLISGEAGLQRLRALRSLGVYLAVDDFGTGYSSLAHLKDLPAEVLKVDRRFVTGLGRDTGDSAIVASTVGLATALGMHVIAEGIERPDQVAQLRALGCRVGQGYLFGQPVPGTALQGPLQHGFPEIVGEARAASGLAVLGPSPAAVHRPAPWCRPTVSGWFSPPAG
jgi:diguanylate cyclase (GGDEF)-like protein/PAS domain S-box-containing protein